MMKTQPQNLKDLNKNPLAVPKITKVVINVGIGRLVANAKNSEEIIKKISINSRPMLLMAIIASFFFSSGICSMLSFIIF